jgi:hypothetical protein
MEALRDIEEASRPRIRPVVEDALALAPSMTRSALARCCPGNSSASLEVLHCNLTDLR